jgi:branched-chain amino acid transport system ATP-binding protein
VILEVRDIHTFYGTSHILFGVSLGVGEGETVCLLGRNGAGKSTTLRSIMGLTPPASGSITYRGVELIGKPTYTIARLGIGFVPDDRGIFADLTVHENLEVAETRRRPGGTGEAWTLERLYAAFPALQGLRDRRGEHLSGGEQRLLSVARALLTHPRLLVFDEPAEGLSPLVVRAVRDWILRLKQNGISILLSEQNVRFAMEVSDRAYVIDNGVIRHQGTVDELRGNEEVRKRYLMV